MSPAWAVAYIHLILGAVSWCWYAFGPVEPQPFRGGIVIGLWQGLAGTAAIWMGLAPSGWMRRFVVFASLLLYYAGFEYMLRLVMWHRGVGVPAGIEMTEVWTVAGAPVLTIAAALFFLGVKYPLRRLLLLTAILAMVFAMTKLSESAAQQRHEYDLTYCIATTVISFAALLVAVGSSRWRLVWLFVWVAAIAVTVVPVCMFGLPRYIVTVLVTASLVQSAMIVVSVHLWQRMKNRGSGGVHLPKSGDPPP